jgi:PAS domain S-box-containing protein
VTSTGISSNGSAPQRIFTTAHVRRRRFAKAKTAISVSSNILPTPFSSMETTGPCSSTRPDSPSSARLTAVNYSVNRRSSCFIPIAILLFAQRIKRLSEDGESLAMTKERIVKLDGSIVNVEVMASAFLDQGMRGQSTSFCIDITEPPRAEQILSAMAQTGTVRPACSIPHCRQSLTWLTSSTATRGFSSSTRRSSISGGWELKDAVGKNFFELGYPEALAAKLHAQIHRIFETDERITDETAYTSPTGVSGFYEYIFSPLHADDGSVDVVAGSMRDITKHKQTEEAERQRTEQFETLLNEAPLDLYMVDGDFRIWQANPTAQLVFGNIPDLIGRDFDEVIHVLWPQAYADEIVGIFHHTLETG